MDDKNGLVLWGCGTPRTLRAHWALRELGCAYRCEPVQPRLNDARKAALEKLNSRGKIPVLQDGDFTLTESAAIVNYLFATRASGAAATEPRARARHDEWCFFLMTELDATSLYVLRRHVGLANIYGEAPAAVAAAKDYFQKQVATVSEALADGRPWLLGETLTGADILLASCVAMAAPYNLPLSEALAAYRDRAASRPAYAAAVAANRPDHWTAQ